MLARKLTECSRMFTNPFSRLALVLGTMFFVFWMATTTRYAPTEHYEAVKTTEQHPCATPFATTQIHTPWKYRLGNDLSWSKMSSRLEGFIDAKGYIEEHNFSVLNKSPHFWLSATFETPAPSTCRPTSLRIEQIGGIYELFLNGTRLISPDPEHKHLRDPSTKLPITISVPYGLLAPEGVANRVTVHKIAFTNPGGVKFKLPGDITLLDSQSLSEPIEWTELFSIFTPLFLILIGLQQLLIWAIRPEQHMSFFFFLFSVSCSWITIIETRLVSWMNIDGTTFSHLAWFGSFINPLTFLLFLQSLFSLKSPWWMWIPSVILCGLACIGLFQETGLFYNEAFSYSFPLFLLSFFHLLWVFFRAISKRDPSAFWLLGAILILVMLAVVELVKLSSGTSGTNIIQIGFFTIGLTILFTMSRTTASQIRLLNEQARNLELRVNTRTTELQSTINVLHNRNQDLDSIARTLAHDLRSPLSTIQTLSGLLSDPNEVHLSEDGQQTVAHIQTSTAKLMGLLEGIKSLAMVGRANLPKELIDLNLVAQDAIEMLDAELRENQAVVEIVDELPIVPGHESDLTTLFLNLIQNAVHHHPGPSPKVQFRYHENRKLGLLPLEQECHLVSIEDNGAGIPADFKDLIFRPFQRGPVAQSAGQGIGLSVAQRVLSNLNGRIWVEDSESQGSIFYMAFPVQATLEKEEPRP
jgi:signal transduction histidine kinase